MRIISVVYLVALILISSHSFGATVDYHRYDLYQGDVDSNGVADLYFHGKGQLVILHGDIATPITVPPPPSFTVNGVAGDYFISYQPNLREPPLAESQLTGYRKLVENFDYFLGDFNGDGTQDVFVLNDYFPNSGNVSHALVMSGSFSGATPSLWAMVQSPDSALVTSLRNGSATIRDVTGDGKDNFVVPSGNYFYADSAYSVAAEFGFGFLQVTALIAPEVKQPSLVGATAGSFRVNETGAATYSIPVALPAGIAGVAPEISLSYSSQGGNGLLGRGWALGGLSGIARCRQTLTHENNARPLTWSAEDRFCLDGQRLVLTSGSYGANLSTYRTEIDSFATITAHGGDLGNPSYFVVERKDGSISYYGDYAGASDATQTAPNLKHMSWSLKQFQDSVGNKIVYGYSEDSDGHRIANITYAYSSAATYHSAVLFGYEDRLDHSNGFVGGYQMGVRKRLAEIKVFDGQNEVRKYELLYQKLSAGAYSKVSQLAAVQECVGASCLPATRFDWSADVYNFNSQTSSSTIALEDDQAVIDVDFSDIDGNGCIDAIFAVRDFDEGTDDDDYMVYGLSDCTKLNWTSWTWGGTHFGLDGPGTKVKLADYNADGRADAFIYHPTFGRWRVFLSTPQGNGIWKLQRSHISTSITNAEAIFADFNSDGLVDVFAGGSFRYLERNPSQAISSNQFYRFSAPVSSGVSTYTKAEVAGDLNADGITDLKLTSIVSGPSWEGHPAEYFSVDSLYTVDQSGQLTSYGNVAGDPYNIFPTTVIRGNLVADINGDGYTDEISGTAVALNRGNGAFTNFIHAGGMENEDISVIDYNGDGYGDLINKRGKIALWNPNTQTFAAAITTFGGTIPANESVMWFDVNADGKTDRVRLHGGTLKTNLALANSSGPNQPLVTAIDNGLGNKTVLNYDTLAKSDHYSRISLDFVQTPNIYLDNYYNYTLDVGGFYSALNGDWELPGGSQTLAKYKPVLELTGPVYVVTKAESTSPSAGTAPGNVSANSTSSISYYYGEAKIQASGRGLLGFHKLRTIDNQSGVKTTTTYRQDFPFIGNPLETVVETAAGDVLKRSTNTWQLYGWDSSWPNAAKAQGTLVLGPLKPFLAKSVEQTYATHTDLNLADKLAVYGELASTVTTETQVDAHGNATQIMVTTAGGGSSFTTTTNNYYGSSSNTYEQRFGRLSKTETSVSQTINGVTTASPLRTVGFAYYNIASSFDSGGLCAGDIRLTGLLCLEIVEPNKPAYRLQTLNEYDSVGNKIKVTQSGNDVEPRYSRTVYDSAGRYVDETYNALEHRTQQVVNRNELGQPTLVYGLNNSSVTTSYDKLGRVTYATDNTGAWTQTKRMFCGSQISCPNSAVYAVESTVAGGGRSLGFFDALGRSVRSGSKSFEGTMVFVDTEYDKLGRVKHVSEPFYEGSAPAYWTKTNYDVLGRPISVIRPDNETITTAYSYHSTTLTNPLNHSKTEVRNVRGDLVLAVDHLNGKIAYEYDHFGNLLKATPYGSNTAPTSCAFPYQNSAHCIPQFNSPISTTVSLSYDDLGRKKSMSDPDKGVWSYTYTAFGELKTQTDAKNQVTSQSYDVLGRMRTRTDKASTGAVATHTRWYYDGSNDIGSAVPNSIGQLTAVVQSQNAAHERCDSSTTQYCERYGYDAKGRALQTQVLIGVNGSAGTYTSAVDYDNIGRVYREYDVLNNTLKVNGATQISGIEREFNIHGFVSRTRDLASGTVIRETLETNVRGQVERERLANQAVSTYTYDPILGRLQNQTAQLGSLFPIQNLTYTWGVTGNLRSRHDQSIHHVTGQQKSIQESFCYDGLNRLIKAARGTLNFNCAGLGAASQDIEYNALGNIMRKVGVGSYVYGANNAGPHALSSTADGVTYNYDNNGNMAGDSSGRSIIYSTFDKPLSISKGGHTTAFKYGPSRGRYQRSDTSNGVTKTTFYLGNIERISSSNTNTIEWKRYLDGVMIHSIVTDANLNRQSEQKQVVYTDHLGSTDVLTDLLGNVTESMSFDPWGQRRDAVDWSTFTVAELINFDYTSTTRGFTSHEMLDEVGIIHMNGRIYDPRLGRFLQADPHVDGVTYTQGFNRYSYLHNNPLNGTDPTGFKSLKEIFGPMGGSYAGLTGDFLGAFGVHKTHEFMASSQVMSSIYIAAVGIVSAYYCGECSIGFTAYASADMAWYQTGSVTEALKAGAISGVSAAAFYGVGTFIEGPVSQVVAHGVVGGVMAELQGGEFGHGFVSAGLTKAFTVGGAIDTGSYVGNITLAAVVGGTASVISGGKFANGAVTGAFSYVFNCVLTGNGCPKPVKLPDDYSRFPPGFTREMYDHYLDLDAEGKKRMDERMFVREQRFQQLRDSMEKLEAIVAEYRDVSAIKSEQNLRTRMDVGSPPVYRNQAQMTADYLYTMLRRGIVPLPFIKLRPDVEAGLGVTAEKVADYNVATER